MELVGTGCEDCSDNLCTMNCSSAVGATNSEWIAASMWAGVFPAKATAEQLSEWRASRTNPSSDVLEQLQAAIDEGAGDLAVACKAIIERLSAELAWQPIETAPKDGRYIVAVYRALPDGYAAHLDGRTFVVRHEGKSPSGYDLGWAMFPGFGGVPDKSLSHWRPLPDPPTNAALTLPPTNNERSQSDDD